MCCREGLKSYKQFIQELEDDILPAEAERRLERERDGILFFFFYEADILFIGCLNLSLNLLASVFSFFFVSNTFSLLSM